MGGNDPRSREPPEGRTSSHAGHGAGGRRLGEAGGRVLVRAVTAEDRDEVVALARASVELHRPWYSMPTRGAFQGYLARFRQPGAEGFLVCVRPS